MGRLEREQTQLRNEKQLERVTVYSALPHQTFMVHGIKAPMIQSIVTIISPESSDMDRFKALLQARRVLANFEKNFPEPQHGIEPISGLPYVWHPNSHTLIDIRDEYFKHCQLEQPRLKLLRMGIDFVIIIYDYDPPYRMMIDWWAKQLKILNWRYDIPITINARDWKWWIENPA